MPARTLIAAGAATLAVAGASAGVYGTLAAAAPRHRVSLKEREYRLVPKRLVARHGTVTIKVRNTGQITHALEVEHGGRRGHDVETHHIRPGRSATLKLHLKKGKYEIYCPIPGHKALGMKGVLVVR